MVGKLIQHRNICNVVLSFTDHDPYSGLIVVQVGLLLLPHDGNPHNSKCLVAHPGKASSPYYCVVGTASMVSSCISRLHWPFRLCTV